MIVVKLGGSVITDKSTPETVDDRALERAASALAEVRASGGNETHPPMVVVHGAGSFGHHHAERHGLTVHEGTHDATALWDVHDAMRRLNDRVTTALREAGLAPAPVHPFSLAHRDRGGDLTMPVEGVATMVGEGFVPVLHGDGVVQRGAGVTILSGDEVVVRLARDLDADRVGMCSTVPGVLRDGDVIPRIEALDDARDVLGGADGVDVTGGMAAKVDTLLGVGTAARIFGLDDLPGFLAGDDVGTLVDGRRR